MGGVLIIIDKWELLHTKKKKTWLRINTACVLCRRPILVKLDCRIIPIQMKNSTVYCQTNVEHKIIKKFELPCLRTSQIQVRVIQENIHLLIRPFLKLKLITFFMFSRLENTLLAFQLYHVKRTSKFQVNTNKNNLEKFLLYLFSSIIYNSTWAHKPTFILCSLVNILPIGLTTSTSSNLPNAHTAMSDNFKENSANY